MSILIENKLNHLLSYWPGNAIITTHWLSNQGYSNQLLKKYYDHGWLSKAGQGAYTKLKSKPNWVGGVHALQHELALPAHVGGLTALEIYGMAHNIIFDPAHSSFYLFNTSNTKKTLPTWFRKSFPQHIYAQYHLFDGNLGLEARLIEQLNITISTPEQAALELLALVPHAFDYEHAAHIIENLHFLRPTLLQKLLQQCTSIKVKRLFLYLAEKYQLPCLAHLNMKKFNLGKGKRVIGQGGEYISAYQLSVPRVSTEDESGINHV